MSLLKQLYRTIIPTRTRTRVMHLREKGVAFALREAMYDFRRDVGWNRAVVRVPHGRLSVDLRDTIIARLLYMNREFEPIECAFLASVLKPGMVVYDIGANLGYHTVLAAQLVGKTGRVISFEPDPVNYRLLSENIRRQKLTNVTALNLALGSTPGTLEMHTSKSNFGDHRMYETQAELDRNKHLVEVARLDDIVLANQLPPPDFVKLDVQGYEGHVLEGAVNTLSPNRSFGILLEYWPHGMRMAGSADPGRFIGSLLSAQWTGEQLGWVGQLEGRGVPRRPLRWEELHAEIAAREKINPEGAFIDLAFHPPARNAAEVPGSFPPEKLR